MLASRTKRGAAGSHAGLVAMLWMLACAGGPSAQDPESQAGRVVPLDQELTVATSDKQIVELVTRCWYETPTEPATAPARLESIVSEAIRSAAAKLPVGTLVEDRRSYEESLRRAVGARLRAIDTELRRFELREVVLPPALAQSIRLQQEAEQEEMRRRNQAEAEKRRGGPSPERHPPNP